MVVTESTRRLGGTRVVTTGGVRRRTSDPDTLGSTRLPPREGTRENHLEKVEGLRCKQRDEVRIYPSLGQVSVMSNRPG